MRNWTEEQLNAIESRGADLIVSAGAGSGKTAVMIERICSLLREGADISRMMVCTFTKTAAADMKRKLAQALSAESDPRVRRNVSKLSCAEISTLHSWCAHLIKTWFFQTDIDPSFTVLEEGEEFMLKRQSAEEAVAKFRSEGDGAFAGLYEAFRASRSHRKLSEAAVTVYDYSRAQANPAEWLSKSAQRTDSEYRAYLAKTYAERARALSEKVKRLQVECKSAGAPSDYEALCALEAAIDVFGKFELRTKPLGKNKSSEEALEIHESYMALKKAYADLYAKKTASENLPSHESSLAYCRALSTLAAETGRIYAQKKEAACKADYSDLEHCALGILRGEHGEEIVKGYDFVFADEYQDISPLQEEILSVFKERNPDCLMFYVGDVKQSIYGFRMCSPEYFVKKQNEYENGKGAAINLNTNFRSGKSVLDAVNRVFCNVMTEDFGRVNYRDEASLTAGLDMPSSVSAVFTEPQEDDGEQQKLGGIYSVKNDTRLESESEISLEADAVTNEIISLLEEGYEFGNIAVLVRSRGRFTDVLADKLRAESIPVSVVSSDASADSFESVSSLISFLRVLDNFQDDVNLAAVMLSPVFGKFTLDELAEMGNAATLGERTLNYAEKHPDGKVAEFVRSVNRFREIAAESTVGELAGKITAEYKCFGHALMTGGEREAAALDAFSEHLAATERDTLGDYLAFVNACGVPKLKVTDGGKAVSIMTVHASKGLEFPCVILPELDKQFNRSDTYASVICDRDEGVVLRTFDFDNRTVKENPRYACVASRLGREQTEEELRILYVAMTRAKERLVMFAKNCALRDENVSADKAASYMDWMYELLQAVRKTPVKTQVSERAGLRTRANGEICKILAQKFETEEKLRGEDLRISASVKASVSGIAHRDDEEESVRIPSLCADDRAAEKGSAYHKFMQYADFGKPGEWERLCEKFPREGELIGKRDDVEAAFANMKDFIRGRKFFREKAFVYKVAPAEIGENGNGKVLVQGVIDLLVTDDDGFAEIVDYKTGSERSVLNPAYTVQLALYKKAVEEALGIKVKAAYLYGFSTRKFYKTEPKTEIGSKLR